MTRKYGTGSLYLNSSSGRWVARLPDGRGGYRYRTGVDREDVRRWLETARQERDRRNYGSRRGGERLRDLVTRYLSDVAPVTVRARTLEGYEQLARDHVAPAIGTIRVTQLELTDVQRMVNAMLARGLSRRTAANAVAVVSAALGHAQREGTIAVNVARLVKLPPDRRERLPSLSTDDLRRFLEVTRGEPLWPAWVLLGTTGLRVGELLGLRWSDVQTEAPHAIAQGADSAIAIHSATGVHSVRAITSPSRDFEAPLESYNPVTITVAGQWRYAGVRDGEEVWERVEPKTARSRRILHLPTLAREALRWQRTHAGSTALVFCGRHGQPMNRSHLNRRFHDALTAHGFGLVRLHSLRHAAAVAMLDNVNGDLRVVSATLGHSSLRITADIYGADADAARKRGSEAMDRAMTPVRGRHKR